MASGASKLENELVAFVEGHPETFSQQDVVNLRRNIIIHFFQIVGPPHNAHPHVISVVKLIMENIQSKVKPINTSQDVKDALELFNLGVTCQTIINGRGNILMLEPPSPPDYRDNFYSRVKRHVNEYHVKVLKLWADALVRKGEMTPTAIAEMQTRVGAKDGYERKMRELCGNPSGMVWGKTNLNESVLLDFLTMFHVATPAQMTAKYDNIGPLDHIVFTIISQFVPMDNVSGIPTGNHETELNLLNLKCVVVMLPPSQSPTPPIFAYLSSDVLDQCVQSVGRFPTAEEFNQCLSKRMIEKAAAFAVPPPPSAAPHPPPPSAPELHELDGGKKTKRIMSKKRNHSKKSRHHRR